MSGDVEARSGAGVLQAEDSPLLGATGNAPANVAAPQARKVVLGENNHDGPGLAQPIADWEERAAEPAEGQREWDTAAGAEQQAMGAERQGTVENQGEEKPKSQASAAVLARPNPLAAVGNTVLKVAGIPRAVRIQLFMVFGVSLSVWDLVSDALVAARYWSDGHKVWSVVCMGILIFNLGLNAALTFIASDGLSDDAYIDTSMKEWFGKVGSCVVWVVSAFFGLHGLVAALAAWRIKGHDLSEMPERLPTFNGMEALTEAGPQLLLQLYVFMATRKGNLMHLASMATSVIAMSWGITVIVFWSEPDLRSKLIIVVHVLGQVILRAVTLCGLAVMHSVAGLVFALASYLINTAYNLAMLTDKDPQMLFAALPILTVPSFFVALDTFGTKDCLWGENVANNTSGRLVMWRLFEGLLALVIIQVVDPQKPCRDGLDYLACDGCCKGPLVRWEVLAAGGTGIVLFAAGFVAVRRLLVQEGSL